jgi:hypothetical protein
MISKNIVDSISVLKKENENLAIDIVDKNREIMKYLRDLLIGINKSLYLDRGPGTVYEVIYRISEKHLYLCVQANFSQIKNLRLDTKIFDCFSDDDFVWLKTNAGEDWFMDKHKYLTPGGAYHLKDKIKESSMVKYFNIFDIEVMKNYLNKDISANIIKTEYLVYENIYLNKIL